MFIFKKNCHILYECIIKTFLILNLKHLYQILKEMIDLNFKVYDISDSKILKKLVEFNNPMKKFDENKKNCI